MLTQTQTDGVSILDLPQEVIDKIRLYFKLKGQLMDCFRKNEEKYVSMLSEKDFDIYDQLDDVGRVEWFMFNFRFRNGGGFIDRFIREQRNLSKTKLAILKEWKNPLEGFYEIKSVDEYVITLVGLFDKQEYVAIATAMDPEAREALRPGYVVTTRLLPLQGVYVLSGRQRVFPFASEEEIRKFAKYVASVNPSYVLSDEKKLAQAWEHQEEHRRGFISYFGSDLVLIPGEEINATMGRFFDHIKDVALAKKPETRPDNGNRGPFDPAYPDQLTGSRMVGVILDRDEGLVLYPDFDLFLEPFRDTRLLAKKKHRDAVLNYLYNDDMSPLPFRKMVEIYPENAAEVFARLLDRSDWDNNRDFPRLMKKYKARFLHVQPRPFLVPVGGRLAEAMRGDR